MYLLVDVIVINKKRNQDNACIINFRNINLILLVTLYNNNNEIIIKII